MPELPEVEHVRRGLQGLKLVAPVRSVWRSHYNLRTGAAWSREQEFTARLRRATPRDVQRRGKYILWNFDSPASSRPQLLALIHLGMTGRCVVHRDDEAREPHTHVSLSFEDGRRFDFIDPRRFGGFVVASPEEIFARDPIARLGPEPLEVQFNAEILRARAGSSRRVVRQALLDQSVVAGLGNIYVSEALHLASVAPLSRCTRILASAWARLASSIVEVLDQAICGGGTTLRDYRRVDGTRGENQHALLAYGRAGLPCGGCSTILLAHSSQGRTGVHCPSCQAAGPGGWVS